MFDIEEVTIQLNQIKRTMAVQQHFGQNLE